MDKNFSSIIFLLTLISGSLISISSNSWMGAWMGLEINLLSFIPLISNSNNMMSNESSLKYFLVQVLASSILLFSVIMNSLFNGMNTFLINDYIFILILNSSLLIKMGAAPFHFWFPGVMEGLSWFNNFILMTWQKIAPMILLMYCLNYKFITYIVIICVIIGSIGGINQTSLRKLMAYSSINHIGWMLSSMFISNLYWFIYFMSYSILSLSIIYMFNYFNIFFMNQCYNIMNFSPVMKFLMFFNFLSLGGLPPFLGFFPKWILIQNLINYNMFMLIIMVMMTLITLFFYIRITYSAFMLNYTESKWMSMYTNTNFTLLILNFTSLFGLSIIFFIYNLF
uniref:NADH-ubiquinone oxidoreductase chain 2 n=1 Tax=Osmylus fulvicephalus TaxID=446453 RepID=A0A7G7WS64_9NEOP|nr:NADH dehydrogenase subunit 2 [Osmylus fulvicephalus]QNH69890.1 NADH dehydrogenase subunit 2 [Osmylus fulvicephalus]